jgi:hypothetical protein
VATKFYTKKAQYRLSAWHLDALYMDGIYIDGALFEGNGRVVDGIIRMAVTPDDAHMVGHWIKLGFPSFQNGKVVRIGSKFEWAPNTAGGKYQDLYYDGSPYGIGLNTIAAELRAILFPITRDIIYEVVYVFMLEVE